MFTHVFKSRQTDSSSSLCTHYTDRAQWVHARAPSTHCAHEYMAGQQLASGIGLCTHVHMCSCCLQPFLAHTSAQCFNCRHEICVPHFKLIATSATVHTIAHGCKRVFSLCASVVCLQKCAYV